MDSFFAELKRRNVFRVAGVYAVVGWLLAQVSTTLEETLSLPAWFDSLIVAILLLGLPIALILAWAFELTPEGVVRTEAVPEAESIAPKTGRKLDYAIVGGLILLGGLILWQQASREPVADSQPPVAAHMQPAPESTIQPFRILIFKNCRQFFAREECQVRIIFHRHSQKALKFCQRLLFFFLCTKKIKAMGFKQCWSAKLNF